MTNDFLVQAKEILLIDEADFVVHGGEAVEFGHIDGGVVCLRVTGSAHAIGHLACAIIGHRTAAR